MTCGDDMTEIEMSMTHTPCKFAGPPCHEK